MKTKTLISLIAMAAVWFTACDKNDNSTLALAINPNDGETNVALNKSVTLNFDTPMVRSIVQNNFHMMTTQKMTKVRDSMMTYVGMMGDMMGSMTHDDSMTIYNGMMRMMNNDGMRGTFTWNSDSTQCTFDPDSLMMTNTAYSMHMAREMMTMTGMMQGDGMMSGNNHGMMGNAGGMMHGDMMTNFTTGSSMMKTGNFN